MSQQEQVEHFLLVSIAFFCGICIVDQLAIFSSVGTGDSGEEQPASQSRTSRSEKKSWRDLIMVKILLNAFILLKQCQDIDLSLLFRRKPRSKLREERDIKCFWMR